MTGFLRRRPTSEIMGLLKSDGPGGFAVRRLMVPVLCAPLVLGRIVRLGEARRWYVRHSGDLICSFVYVSVLMLLLWAMARSQKKLDAERRRGAEIHSRNEQKFRDLFDDAPVGYHELDYEGRIVRINRTELRLLGHQAEEMLGHFVWEFLDDPEASRQSVLAELAGTTPPARALERVYQRKDLTTLILLSDDRLLRDARGAITGIRTTLADITARKKASEALVAERSMLRTLIDHLPDTIYVKDVAGRKTLTNPADVRNRGAASEAEVLGKTDFDFCPVRTLGNLVPICSHCEKLRDDKGYWNQLEQHIVEHTDIKSTHGLCPDCAKLYFPGIAEK